MTDPSDKAALPPELKSCPRCRGAADFIGSERRGYNARCTQCGFTGPWGDYGYQAEAAWNRIARPAQGMAMRRHLTSMQRKGGERVRAKLTGKTVRIWSGEHSAWWRPERAGYTVHTEAAGTYTAEEAWDATSHCGPEKRIIFEVVQ